VAVAQSVVLVASITLDAIAAGRFPASGDTMTEELQFSFDPFPGAEITRFIADKLGGDFHAPAIVNVIRLTPH
jgi:hypothetical protein